MNKFLPSGGGGGGGGGEGGGDYPLSPSSKNPSDTNNAWHAATKPLW